MPFVEAVHHLAVFDDKSGVDDAGADGVGFGNWTGGRRCGSNEGDEITFRIANYKMLAAVRSLNNSAGFHAMSHEIEAEFENVVCREGQFREPILGSGCGRLLEFDVLRVWPRIYREAEVRHVAAAGVSRSQTKVLGVEGAGFIEV